MDYAIAIATLKQADPRLAVLIEQVGNCELDRAQQSGDLFTTLARSILYQQLSGRAAGAIYQRFLMLYAGAPSAAEVLDTPDDSLRQVGISRSKVLYLKDLARYVLAGLPSLEALAQQEDEAIIQTLTPIKGVGRWTVQMLLIFRLHRWDVWPVDDLGVRSGLRKLYQLPELPPRPTVEELGQPWRPYRTIVAWYLWRSLEIP